MLDGCFLLKCTQATGKWAEALSEAKCYIQCDCFALLSILLEAITEHKSGKTSYITLIRGHFLLKATLFSHLKHPCLSKQLKSPKVSVCMLSQLLVIRKWIFCNVRTRWYYSKGQFQDTLKFLWNNCKAIVLWSSWKFCQLIWDMGTFLVHWGNHSCEHLFF